MKSRYREWAIRIVNDLKDLGFSINIDSLLEDLEDYELWYNEAREIRRREADWEFIEKQPEPIRTALKLLVEIGDLWVAAKVAGMKLDEFNELRLKANIPIVI